MSTVFPLSTYYMWDVVETLPTKEQRMETHIGSKYLPSKDFGSYRIVWEEVRNYSPMAGFYAMSDLADPMHGLPWKTIQTDFLHSAARWIIDPQDIMFFRMPGQPGVSSQFYGTGPAAHDYRSRDQATVAERTKMMVEGLDNLNEYMRMKALLGQLVWPPVDAAGNAIAAASMPIYWGRQALDMPYPLLAAGGGHGGFSQAATTLLGAANSVTAQGIAWNIETGVAATSANIIRDFSVIKSLMKRRKSLPSSHLTAIMSEEVLSWQAWNTNVLDWLLGQNRDREFLTVEEITTAVQVKWGFKIQTYDAVWEYIDATQLATEEPTINSVEFMPIGQVLILPEPEWAGMGFLGHCPVPVNANGDDLLQWTNGRYFWKDFMTKPPFRREMGTGQFAFPLVKNLDKRFLLDAWN